MKYHSLGTKKTRIYHFKLFSTASAPIKTQQRRCALRVFVNKKKRYENSQFIKKKKIKKHTHTKWQLKRMFQKNFMFILSQAFVMVYY